MGSATPGTEIIVLGGTAGEDANCTPESGVGGDHCDGEGNTFPSPFRGSRGCQGRQRTLISFPKPAL